MRPQLPSREVRQRLGEEAELDLAADLELPLEALRVQLLGVVQALLRERRADARAEDGRVERLRQVIVGAEEQAAYDRLLLRRRRDHHDGNVLERHVLLHDLEDLVARELGHHDVEQHEVERLLRQAVERLASVLGDEHGVAIAAQAPRQQIAVHLVVVDDEDRAHRHACNRDLVRDAHRACAVSPAAVAGAGSASSCRRYGTCSSAARAPHAITWANLCVSNRFTGSPKSGTIARMSA